MKHEAFYTTAAQVIPVLVLVLVFEARFWRFRVLPRDRREATRLWTVAAAFYTSIVAEWFALYSLMTESDKAWRRYFIFIALGVMSLHGGP